MKTEWFNYSFQSSSSFSSLETTFQWRRGKEWDIFIELRQLEEIRITGRGFVCLFCAHFRADSIFQQALLFSHQMSLFFQTTFILFFPVNNVFRGGDSSGILTLTHHLGVSPLGPAPFLQMNYALRITGYKQRLSGKPGSSEESILRSTPAIIC